jgi:hypothetical protein
MKLLGFVKILEIMRHKRLLSKTKEHLLKNAGG